MMPTITAFPKHLTVPPKGSGLEAMQGFYAEFEPLLGQFVREMRAASSWLKSFMDDRSSA